MNKKIIFVITYIILLISIVMQAFISVLIIYTIWYEYNINKYFNIPILIIFLIFNILTLKKLMYEQKNYN